MGVEREGSSVWRSPTLTHGGRARRLLCASEPEPSWQALPRAEPRRRWGLGRRGLRQPRLSCAGTSRGRSEALNTARRRPRPGCERARVLDPTASTSVPFSIAPSRGLTGAGGALRYPPALPGSPKPLSQRAPGEAGPGPKPAACPGRSPVFILPLLRQAGGGSENHTNVQAVRANFGREVC